jgi:tetratricopeptide (TPR) repeat protein
VDSHPYPTWLKAGLLALLALLVVALMHGRRYFSAGRQMYVGEKLVEQGKYAEAVGHLKQTVQVAPGSDKAVLLLAKAALLSGDPNTASDAVHGHNNGLGFDQDSDVQEVQSLFARMKPAIDKANKAMELAPRPGMAGEAASLMHQAASEYPEMRALRDSLPYYDAGAAFENKDYDQFVALSEQVVREQPDSADPTGLLASAYACKFAVTGDPVWKKKAEEMLEKARQLSQTSSDAQKSFEEYAERTRYRLSSRQIIDKPEYDRRFRAGTSEKR